ncbi:iron dicitrate transport regulator FecR [Methylomonas koyamae]|uniref:Iron dicitrate transport regulator FecR n=1 Tax=Methylomonas koyamae TaxID=702114 RepID=A0A177N2P2_9GAMM|nr:FecR family protein [Methylomonas koyamae]OAI11470.1 iron dicitrate transport regulator FecR [Methylomonas koyamae]
MSLAKLTEPQRQALDWLSRLRDSDAGPDEQQQFQEWLSAAAEHAAAYEQILQFWQQLGGLPELASNQLNTARGFVRQNQLARRRRNLALAVVALAIGLAVKYPEQLQKSVAVRYQTAIGERQSVELADGSRIELNTASSMRVDRFGARTVWLEQGEAWFNVKHDADRPFEVRVGAGRIRDVGTQFNVSIGNGHTSVAVVEGEVALSVPGRQELALTAGLQAGFAGDGSLQPPRANDAGAGAWRDGILVFKQQPLPEVLRQLARYHPVEFDLPDAKLQTLTVSGRFSTTDLNESLNTLQNGLGVRAIKTAGSKILIRAKD